MDVESLKQRNKELFDNFILYDTRSEHRYREEAERNVAAKESEIARCTA